MIWLLARISLLEYISHLSNYIQWMPLTTKHVFLRMTFICTESNFFQCLHEMSNTLCTIRSCCVWKADFYEKNRYQALRKRVICQKVANPSRTCAPFERHIFHTQIDFMIFVYRFQWLNAILLNYWKYSIDLNIGSY